MTPPTLPRTAVLLDPDEGDQLRAAIERRLDIPVSVVDPAAPTAELDEASVVVSFDPPGDLRDRMDSVEWVHALTAGVDGYDLDWFRERGVALTGASGVVADPVAEQVLGYLLTFERRLHRAIRQQERGEWDWFGGHELSEETVGVVGVGAIGGRVAELVAGLGTDVVATTRDGSCDHPAVGTAYPTDDLPAMLAAADYTVLACPLTDATRGLIGAAELRAMPDHGVLVNVARGPIVDTDALVEALRADRLRGAALDVFDTEPLPTGSPLWDLEAVVLTPHNAGSTPHFWERSARLFARNVEAFRDGRPLTNRVV